MVGGKILGLRMDSGLGYTLLVPLTGIFFYQCVPRKGQSSPEGISNNIVM